MGFICRFLAAPKPHVNLFLVDFSWKLRNFNGSSVKEFQIHEAKRERKEMENKWVCESSGRGGEGGGKSGL